MPATKKFTPEIDAKLYKEFVAVAKRNGQSQRHILEEALKCYLKNVASVQHLARTEVMKTFDQSVARNRDLLERLAKWMTESFHSPLVTSDLVQRSNLRDHYRGRDARVSPNRCALSSSFQRT